ncbi:MAG: phosphatase [Endomicrobium sp.]|nr:phosphatase [Endomicrobium sp.]
MKISADLHTHSIASGHAYSTIQEMITFAKTNKIKTLAITEHGYAMPDACHEYYYHNLCSLSREMFGVNLIFGCEANILDYTGRIDLSDVAAQQCDIIIASLHSRCIKPGTENENTEAIIGAMKNKNVSIIGHPDDGRYKLNYEEVVKNAAKYNVFIELNSNSMDGSSYRQNSEENMTEILKLCKKHKVMISIGSDAHVAYHIGNFKNAEYLINKTRFPKELILNCHSDLLKNIGRN